MAFKVANDAVASERSIFSENQDYKSFLVLRLIRMYLYLVLVVHGSKKLITYTHPVLSCCTATVKRSRSPLRAASFLAGFPVALGFRYASVDY